MSFLKSFLLCSFSALTFHSEKCARQVKLLIGKNLYYGQFSSGKSLGGKKRRNFKKKKKSLFPDKIIPDQLAYVWFKTQSSGKTHATVTNIDHELLFLSFLWLHAVNTFSNFRKHLEKVPYLLQHQIFGPQL